MADYSQLPEYQTLYKQIYGNTGPGGFQWNQQNTSGWLNNAINDFTMQYQNLTGQAPTQDQINSYLSSVVGGDLTSQAGLSGTSPTDLMNQTQQYVSTAFPKQVQGNSLQNYQDIFSKLFGQEQDMFKNNLSTLQGQIPDIEKQIMDYYGKGPGAQQLQGQLNNSGLLNSGAFNSALANAVTGSTIPLEESILSGFSIPAAGQMQGIPGQGVNAALGQLGTLQNQNFQNQQSIGQNQQNLYDFNLQSDLAQRLAEMAQPSGFQTGIGEASSIMQGLGSLGQGIEGYRSGTSYICYALIDHGLATEYDLDALHYKVLGSVWKKARAFWWYATHAKELVQLANEKGIDWSQWKKWFLDDPILAKDSISAVDEYISAYESLCYHVDAQHLWDDRVRRKSFFDSLRFLPFVFTYPPFIKAALKVIRIKMCLIIDIPKFKMN